ncbi:hypothetical protein ACIB24_16910 [Spongisporangium articulatum]|uniref:Transcriptional regulator, AbiEi antitoxin, Type IV TA system n=1 Tax=Spongisporangium articulatum TaxID=3362603 RepID=A0ABW8AT26_9ACTN
MFVPGTHLSELISLQEGLISRSQLLATGLSVAQARQNARTGRWTIVSPGVYSTFTGPLSDRMRVWAALLAVGAPVAASHRTALWLDGLLESPPDAVRLAVPARRTVTALPGAKVMRRRDFERLIRRAANPPRLRLEVSVLDAADEVTSADAVLRLVFAATHGRFTTVERLRSELASRPRHRWRRLLEEVMCDVEVGVASTLELRYARDVERPHGLPRGERNRTERSGATSRYRDVRYKEWHVLVELDGRGAHPDDLRFRDWRRDNLSTLADDDTLRYGWHDVTTVPCEVAHQVVTLLRRNGWPGSFRTCGRCRR